VLASASPDQLCAVAQDHATDVEEEAARVGSAHVSIKPRANGVGNGVFRIAGHSSFEQPSLSHRLNVTAWLPKE
jgi:hypothetical protein